MKFNKDRLKEISRPMTLSEREEIENRYENRDWLALSAKFALSLRHILRTEKMTQTELAKRMDVSCAQITKILSGKENIGLQTIAKVEKALNRRLVTFEGYEKDNPYSSDSQTLTQIFSLTVYCESNTPPSNSSQRPESYSHLFSGKILA